MRGRKGSWKVEGRREVEERRKEQGRKEGRKKRKEGRRKKEAEKRSEELNVAEHEDRRDRGEPGGVSGKLGPVRRRTVSSPLVCKCRTDLLCSYHPVCAKEESEPFSPSKRILDSDYSRSGLLPSVKRPESHSTREMRGGVRGRIGEELWEFEGKNWADSSRESR